MIGFLIVMLYYVLEYLFYRKDVLDEALEIHDEKVIEIFKQECQSMKLTFNDECLIQSEKVKVPMVMGLSKSGIRFVLPCTNYTEEEYHIIFRHELLHVRRKDNAAKFYLAFVTALNWYNPLIYKAMKWQAEDIERSCDEAMTLNADMETRKKYAGLILRSSGDTRGFTTCLSSSALSMKERLRTIMKGKKSKFGWLWLCLCACTLILFGGRIAVGVSCEKLGDTLLDGRIDESFEEDVMIDYHQIGSVKSCRNPDVWIEELSNISVAKVAERYWDVVEAECWIGFYFEDEVYSFFFVEMEEGILIRESQNRDKLTRGIYYTEDLTIEQLKLMIQYSG